MNIFFIHTPKKIEENGLFKQYQVMIPPIGIWSLANIAREKGHNVEIIHVGIEMLSDPAFNLANYLSGNSPDMVCFSLHWHLQIYEVHQESLEVKNVCPEATILIGGITASVYYHEIMNDWDHVDLVVRGEAEKTIELIIGNEPCDYSAVPNLSWRKEGCTVHNPLDYTAGEAELDRYCHTGLDLLKNYNCYRGRYFYDRDEPFDKWRSSPRVWYLYVGRGCSVDCSYCGGGKKAHKLFAARDSISFRPAKSVVSDMRTLKNNFDTSSFYICYHPARMAVEYYSEFFKLARGVPDASMIFEYYNNVPDRQFVDKFADSFNLERSQLVFSPTAFSESARKRCCPSAFSDDVIERFVENCDRRGLQSVLFYSPLPQENETEMMRSAEKAAALLKKFPLLAIIIMPIEMEPLSPWSTNPEKYGIKPIRKTFQDYFDHHGRRRGILTEEDLGYEFPLFEVVMDKIKKISDSPGWICFQPYLFDSHGS